MKYLQETMAVARRILIELLRRRRSLIYLSIFPITVLILNVLILAEQLKVSMDTAFGNTAASTLVGPALFFSCLGGSVTTVVAEREQQTLQRLFLSPLNRIAYFQGIFVAHTCIGIWQTFLVYTFASFWGATFKGSIFVGLIIILLSIFIYVGLGFILGTQLTCSTKDISPLIGICGLPLLISGGVFWPSSLFPKLVANIAKINPIYHMNEALLGVLSQGQSVADIASHLRFLLVFAVLMIIVGWWSYYRMLTTERRF